QPRAEVGAHQCALSGAGTLLLSRLMDRMMLVTNSVFAEPPWYGPVCQVVWEGGAARLLPIPIGGRSPRRPPDQAGLFLRTPEGVPEIRDLRKQYGTKTTLRCLNDRCDCETLGAGEFLARPSGVRL